jgi:hypothetical protein
MPKKHLITPVCVEFCSLLLSKPLVLLDIPCMKGIIQTCRAAAQPCCGSKDSAKMLAEKECFRIISNLDEKEREELKTTLLSDKKEDTINIQFKKINKNIII